MRPPDLTRMLKSLGACVTLRLCLSGRFSAQEKFSIFMRHRYSSCVEVLLELLDHQHHQHHPTAVSGRRPALLGAPTKSSRESSCCLCLQETVLCCLMQMAAAEGKQPPLDQDQDLDWSEHHSFPRELILVGAPPAGVSFGWGWWCLCLWSRASQVAASATLVSSCWWTRATQRRPSRDEVVSGASPCS